MNIYELNALIKCIEEKHPNDHDILPFYYKKRKELLKEISTEINQILKDA